MNSEELKNRTKLFAIQTIPFVDSLPSWRTVEILGRQLVRSASSVGANDRSACRARSTADFISKITIVEEEADECQYWLELLLELGKSKTSTMEPLLKETGELTAIFTATGQTAKRRKINHIVKS
jgi:four helix bundle protein